MSANLDLLEGIAHAVRPLLDEIVFVGGAIAELYATVLVLPRARATTDTDALCEAASYVEYAFPTAASDSAARRRARTGSAGGWRPWASARHCGTTIRPTGGDRRQACST